MEKPVRRTLLPGVSDAEAPPPVVIDSRAVVARARRRAIVRDVIDLLLLVCVDGLFLRWNHAHVPFLGRHDSLLVLLGLNAMLIGYVWLVRALPRWTARRVASTWCLAERTRFFRGYPASSAGAAPFRITNFCSSTPTSRSETVRPRSEATR